MARHTYQDRILVTSGNQAPLAAGNRVTSLALGQIGVFDARTRLSVSAATVATTKPREFFLAVGSDANLDTVVDGTIQSLNIGRGHVKAYNGRCYTPARPKIIDVTDICADCGTEYAVKVDITTSAAWFNYGFQQFSKTFNYVSPCCEGCTNCDAGDCVDLARGLKDQINLDPDALFTAIVITPASAATTPAVTTGLSEAQLDAYDVTANGCPVLRIIASTQGIKTWLGIPEQYEFPRGIGMQVSLQGFSCCGAVSTKQEAVFEEGSGFDIGHREWDIAGYTTGIYRQTESGVFLGPNTRQSSNSGVYAQIELSHDQVTQGGWIDHIEPNQTLVAIPCASTTTISGLAAILDAILTGPSEPFQAIADDLAGCPACNVINLTSAGFNGSDQTLTGIG